jgi:hypothetical protein
LVNNLTFNHIQKIPTHFNSLCIFQTSTEWAIDSSLTKRPRFFSLYWAIYSPLGAHFRPQIFVLGTQKSRKIYEFVVNKLRILSGGVNLANLFLEHDRDVMDAFVGAFGRKFLGVFFSRSSEYVRIDVQG